MIVDAKDPHRGRRGRHHDRHRRMGDRSDRAIETIVVVLDKYDGVVRVAEHLADALDASIIIWDDRDQSVVTDRDHTFAHVDLLDLQAGPHTDHEFCRAVVRADLAIMGTSSRRRPVDAFAEATARAVLVVPNSVTKMPGSRVAIRWDASCQAASALRDSLPLLRDAEGIWIVDVKGRAKRKFGCSDAARYLQRHGFDSYEVEAEGCMADMVAHLVIGAEPSSFLYRQSPEQLAEMLRVPILVSA